MIRQIPLAELDDVLERADALMQSDYAQAMTLLGGVTAALDAPPGDADPFSSRYANWVMGTYLRVAAVDAYRPVEHEADRNLVEELPLTRYFPFNTGDLGVIGRYLTGVGLLLADIQLPPGSRIVEYGVGWGHVATALARAGYDVTCVDIEDKFLTLAARQAASAGCSIKTFHGAFGARPFAEGQPKADGVVFFEAFHHAFDHLDVLRRVRRDVLRPGGALVMSGEPIQPSFPVPWGVRPDGHALWAVRKHKWMELGFREDYFLRALLREGFVPSRTSIESLGTLGLVYRAVLHEGRIRPGETLLPADEQATWAPRSGGGEPRLWAQVDSCMTLDHHPAWKTVTVTAQNHLPVSLEATFYAGGADRPVRRVLAPGERLDLTLPLGSNRRELLVWSETAVPARLGVNDDMRVLGVAVEELAYHP